MHFRKFVSTIFIVFAMLSWMFLQPAQVQGQEDTTNENTTEVPATEPPTIPPTEAPQETTPPETVTSTEPPPATPTTTATAPQKQLQDPVGLYVPDEVLIRFNSIRAKERNDADLLMLKAKVADEIEELGVYLLKIPAGTVETFIATMRNKSGVEYVEPNYYFYALDTTPNDASYLSQYGLTRIRAPQGWDISTGSSGVTIAIVDTGVDINHPDLAGKIVGGLLGKGKDFVNNDDNAQDDNGHGTHVAGIAAASSNNLIGVSGVSWGAKIMPVKVLNSGAGGTVMNISNGIVWAADNNAQVMNLSLGASPLLLSSSTIATIQNAINYAASKNVTIVAASGNGNTVVDVPAIFPNVIAVGATDNTDTRTTYSNYGPELDLMAPGGTSAFPILSTYVGGGYFGDYGTSMSAPFVAGAAAILRGYISSPAAIQAQLQNTALDLGAAGYDNFHGYGLIQLDKALLPFVAVPPTATNPPSASNSAGGWSPLYQPFPSLSPVPWTATLATLTETSTLESSPLITATIPSPSGNETPTPTPTQQPPGLQAQSGLSTWWMPCTALILILLGVLIVYWERERRKKQKNSRW